VSASQFYQAKSGKWVAPGRAQITPAPFPTDPDPDPVGFAHPGVLVGVDQLAWIKSQTLLGGTATATGYSRMLASKTDLPNSLNNGKTYLDPTWTPRPVAFVGRGSGGSNSEGDQDEQADSIAAFANALAWSITGNRANALKAIQIMNAWSAVLQDHKFDWPSPGLYLDGLLQAGWTGAMWPRAAEIIKHTFTSTGSEAVFDAAGFKAMLLRAHVPRVKWGWKGGQANWLLVMADALMQIAVFCDDLPLYELALRNFRAWVPAAIWQVGDVNPHPQFTGYPINPDTPPGAPWPGDYDNNTKSLASFISYWYSPTSTPPWINGLSQEAGRDPHHTAMSFASIGNMCETARLQGNDLWGEYQARIRTGSELICGWLYSAFVQGNVRPVGWPFTANVNTSTPTSFNRVTFYAIRNRLNDSGLSTPNTNNLITGHNDGTSYVASLHSAFEKLLFSGTP
jgi:hypothetical protein